MSGATSLRYDGTGDPPPPPPESASNDPADIASGVPREASIAAAQEARAGGEQAPPVQGATGPDAPADDGGASGATGAPADGASGATGADAEETETVDELLKRDNTPTWMKKTIAQERNRRREADAKAEKMAADLAAAQKRIDEALAKVAELTPPPAPPKPETPRPMREAYTTPEAYDAAVDAWGEQTARVAAERAVADREAAARHEAEEKARTDAEAAQQTAMQTMQEAHRTRRETALSKYADYAEVAESDATRIDVPTAVAIMQAENGPDIAYHLGKNPAEAARIAALTPQQQVFEIGRLSATLAQPTRPAVSKAPPPLRPIGATREVATDANREESMDEVAERVRKRDSAGRVGMWGRAVN